jgi:chromate transporter
MKTEKFSSIKNLWELFCVFFKIGAVTFGGGLAMLPIIEKELVVKRDWISKEKLLDYFAIGQVTPGIIAVNVATFLGYSRAGVFGACLATLGVVTPSIIIISIIAKFLAGFSDIIYVKKALAGINVVVSALLVKVLWGFRKNIFKSFLSIVMFVFAFVGITFLDFNTIIVVIISILCGVVYFFIMEGKNKGKIEREISTSVEKSENQEDEKSVNNSNEGGKK